MPGCMRLRSPEPEPPQRYGGTAGHPAWSPAHRPYATRSSRTPIARTTTRRPSPAWSHRSPFPMAQMLEPLHSTPTFVERSTSRATSAPRPLRRNYAAGGEFSRLSASSPAGQGRVTRIRVWDPSVAPRHRSTVPDGCRAASGHWDFDPPAESQTRAEPKETDGILSRSDCENGPIYRLWRPSAR